jgi:hypothetical protein
MTLWYGSFLYDDVMHVNMIQNINKTSLVPRRTLIHPPINYSAIYPEPEIKWHEQKWVWKCSGDYSL